MKSQISLLFAILVVVTCFSCQKKDDMNPAGMDGTYEFAFQNETNELWMVYSYIFHPNGDLEITLTARENPQGEDLGYVLSNKGFYYLDGEEFSQSLQEYFIWYSEDPEELFGPKDGLGMLEDAEESIERGTLVSQNGGQEIIITFPCKATYEACVGDRVFSKVD